MNKREKTYNMTGGRCFYCGCKLDFNNFHLDHVVPKANGGKYEKNTVPACIECNTLKCDRTIEEFREYINKEFENNIHVRMIAKHYKIKPKPIVFYFEKEGLRPL